MHKPDLVSVLTLHQQADGAGVRGAASTFHTTRVVARVLHLRVREDQHAPVVQKGCLLGDGAVISPPGVQQGKPGAKQVRVYMMARRCTFFSRPLAVFVPKYLIKKKISVSESTNPDPTPDPTTISLHPSPPHTPTCRKRSIRSSGVHLAVGATEKLRGSRCGCWDRSRWPLRSQHD